MINAGREPEKVFLCRRRSSKMRPRNCAQMVQINRDRSAVSVRPPLISSTRSWRAAAAMAVVVVRVLFFWSPSLGLTKRRNERMVASSSHSSSRSGAGACVLYFSSPQHRRPSLSFASPPRIGHLVSSTLRRACHVKGQGSRLG